MILTALPLDVVWHMLRFLDVPDVLACGATCLELHDAISERAVWHYALTALLHDSPYTRIASRIPTMVTEELRARAIRLSRLDDVWAQEELKPRKIQYLTCSRTVRQAELLPDVGGEWLLLLHNTGNFELVPADQDSTHPPIQLTPPVTSASAYSRFKLFTSSSWGAFVLLRVSETDQDGQREDNIYLFGLDTHDLAMHELAHVTAKGLVNYTIGGNLFVYSCTTEAGDDIVYVQTIPDRFGASNTTLSATINLGQELSCQDFILHPLSKDRLLISYTLGLSVYEIPPLIASPADPVLVEPVWRMFFRLQHSLRHATPVLWDTQSEGQTRPLVIMGINAMHIFSPTKPLAGADPTLPPGTYHASRDCRLFFTPPQYCAFGWRRALWDNGRASVKRVASGVVQSGMIVKTCALPQPTDGQKDAKGLSDPRLGTILVPVENDEMALHSSLDETAGRFSLLLSRGHGDRRVAIVDV